MAKTGYGGYFMGGMASGLESGMKMGSQLLELKWRKQAKADAAKADAAMIDALSNLNATFQNNGTYDSIGLGGGYDLGAGANWNLGGGNDVGASKGQSTATAPQYNLPTPAATNTNITAPTGLPKTGSIGVLASKEGMAVIAASMALTDTKANIVKEIMLAIDKGDREKYAQLMDYYKNLTGYIAEFNMAGLSVEDGVNGLFNLLPDEQLKYQKYLQTYGKTPAANMPYEMTRQMGEEAGFDMPETFTQAPELKEIQVKLAEVDKLTFLTEERRNAMKVNILAGGDSATTEKVNAIKAAGGTDADILEAFGAGVRGVNPPKGTETRATSLSELEKYRDKTLNADSWEDAEKIINDYTEAGYDATQLGVTKEAWANGKKSDLDSLVQILDEITAGTPNIKPNEEHSFNLDMGKGPVLTTKTGEEWYKQVYESYVALLKLLEEQGIDTSQYKKLKPPSEVKKAGFWKGAFTGGGVTKGDLTSIYY